MDLIFGEASDNFKAYNVSGHQHQPETEARLQEMTGEKVRLIFHPHLTPMIRGMHSTLYAQLNAKGLPLSNAGPAVAVRGRAYRASRSSM